MRALKTLLVAAVLATGLVAAGCASASCSKCTPGWGDYQPCDLLNPPAGGCCN